VVVIGKGVVAEVDAEVVCVVDTTVDCVVEVAGGLIVVWVVVTTVDAGSAGVSAVNAGGWVAGDVVDPRRGNTAG
jgi:hypothetical protein